MNRSMWARAHVLGGLAIVAVVGWRLGAGPFLDGLQAVDLRSITVAAVITCVTTAACAWRWHVVALGLGVELSLSRAIAAYYRSQFLNTVLPGGVLGDVHRGVDHGRATGDLSRGLRAVAWERIAGQIVQLIIAVLVLALPPSPVRSALPLFLACTAVVALLWPAPRGSRRVPVCPGPHTRGVSQRLTCADGLLACRAWPAITAASPGSRGW